MPAYIDKSGSTCRDFQMLERNLLSHVKLGMLFFLLSSSVLLRARIPGGSSSSNGDLTTFQLPTATIEFVAAFCAFGAGLF